MESNTRTNATIAEIMEGIKSDPEARSAFMAAYNEFRLKRVVKRLVGVSLVLTVCIVLLAVFTACTARSGVDTAITLVETEAVTVTRSGNTISILDNSTSTIHMFTSRRVIRRVNSPQPAPRTAADSDTLRIITHRGVIIVHELKTGIVHVV